MPRRRSPIRLVAAVVVVAAAFLVLGIYLGGRPSDLPGPLADLAGADTQSRAMEQALSIIEDEYYRKVPPAQLTNSSIGGAVEGLHDQFSHYFDRSTFERFKRSSLDPSFSGIGTTVREVPRGLRIVDVYPRTPAAKAGLRRGDVVTAVNGTSIAGKSSDVSTALIRGEPGSAVVLTVERNGEIQRKRITRANVSIPVVSSRIVRQGGETLGYVRLETFSQNAGDEVRQAVARVRRRGARGIVFDLRGNGGGLLQEAVNVASVFVPDGVIVSTDGRARERQVYDATGDAIPTRIPVVVLVDRDTASAAEIVTGALKDHDRAEIIGTHTFGKGVFQELRQLANGGALDITVGEYFTPDGHNLGGGGVKEGGGIAPDITVSAKPSNGQDPALKVGERTLARELRSR